ncbi:MAG: (4Fe-4S)-binding protein, partial [Crenarchaeota archaeon]|nr:(4Fe-4S)-binding protein [Thermoproteota archaeon]
SKNNVEVVGNIPYNSIFTKAMVNGKSIIEYAPESNVSEELTRIWQKLSKSCLS